MSCSPLQIAARRGHGEIVRVLLEHGAEFSKSDIDGRTPLHYAACHGLVDTTRLLLDNGADLQSKSHKGKTPEDLAIAREHPHVAAMLKAEAVRREAVRRAQCVAFATGHHPRLGAGSGVLELEVGVVRMILEEL